MFATNKCVGLYVGFGSGSLMCAYSHRSTSSWCWIISHFGVCHIHACAKSPSCRCWDISHIYGKLHTQKAQRQSKSKGISRVSILMVAEIHQVSPKCWANSLTLPSLWPGSWYDSNLPFDAIIIFEAVMHAQCLCTSCSLQVSITKDVFSSGAVRTWALVYSCLWLYSAILLALIPLCLIPTVGKSSWII